MYQMQRVFCATSWELEGERLSFYDILGQFNEREAMPAGLLYVPVSLLNVRDKRPYQYLVEENLRESTHYILALSGGWGPPERDFQRDYRLALDYLRDVSLPMQSVNLLLRDVPEDASPFASELSARGISFATFTGLDDFREQAWQLFSSWRRGEETAADAAAPAS